MAAPLCDSCHRAWLAWLDYRLPHRIPFVAQATYDTTPAGARDNHRSRFEEWRRTVQQGQDGVRAWCLANHPTVPSVAGDQYVLAVAS